MAISIGDSFSRATAQPRFDDEVFATLAARDAYPLPLRFEGLLVYVEEDQTSYRLKGGVANGNWEVDGGGTGSGLIVADITERDAIPAEDRTQGMTVTVLDDGTGAQVDYWLVGGIGNEHWEEKASKLAVITPAALGLSWTVADVPSKDSSLVLSVDPILNTVTSTTTPFGSAARPNSFTLTLINNDAGDRPITITAFDTDGGLLGDSVTLGYRGATAQIMHIHTINRYVLIGRSN